MQAKVRAWFIDLGFKLQPIINQNADVYTTMKVNVIPIVIIILKDRPDMVVLEHSVKINGIHLETLNAINIANENV